MRGARTAATSWRHFDFWLLGAVALLVIFGITMIRSAVAGNIELEELDLVGRQLIFAGAGFVVILLTTAIDYHLWASISRTLYVLAVAVLATLYLVGAALFGSARWFDTGVILIQPSELAKIVLILVLADFFTRNQGKIGELTWVFRSFLMTMGMVVWILLQPNLSTSIVMFVIWFALLWASGLRLKHLLLFIGAGVVIPVASFPFLVDYQQRRIINFLFPDPTARHGEIYNIQQALISIGSGGLLGAMAHEFGFIITVFVMLVLIFVIWRCLRAARLARDTFGALIAYGVATLIAFQTIVNIGVNLQLMPATGLTLPFVSYGGSSLLSTLVGIGLVESVIVRHKPMEY